MLTQCMTKFQHHKRCGEFFRRLHHCHVGTVTSIDVIKLLVMDLIDQESPAMLLAVCRCYCYWHITAPIQKGTPSH